MNIYHIKYGYADAYVLAMSQSAAIDKWRLNDNISPEIEPDSVIFVASKSDVII